MILIIDANILVGELLRKRGRELLRHADLALYATETVLSEAQYELNRRVAVMVNQNRFPESDGETLLETVQEIIAATITAVAQSTYAHLEVAAKKRIPRDPDDWGTVALALLLDAAIWTQDCDFLGCGCPTWTTETLLLHQ